MTQTDRILRALRQNPAGGINSTDFQIPVCDNGKPILRVAARILDLQDAGYGITSRRLLNGTAQYTLVRDVERDAGSAPKGASGSLPPETGVSLSATLFDVPPARPLGAYESEAA